MTDITRNPDGTWPDWIYEAAHNALGSIEGNPQWKHASYRMAVMEILLDALAEEVVSPVCPDNCDGWITRQIPCFAKDHGLQMSCAALHTETVRCPNPIHGQGDRDEQDAKPLPGRSTRNQEGDREALEEAARQGAQAMFHLIMGDRE